MDILKEIVAPYSLASAGTIIFSLLLSFALGLVIAAVYRWTHTELPTKSFTDTLIILCMLISVVMVIIGDSVARAFSLVGALSIIRFRTVVQDPRDIAFVFFSLAAGMGVGAGDPPVAVIGTFTIGAIIILIHHWHARFPDRKGFVLTFRTPLYPEHEQVYKSVFNKHLTSTRLISQETAKSGALEHRFHVRLKEPIRWMQFFQELSALEGIKGAKLKRQ